MFGQYQKPGTILILIGLGVVLMVIALTTRPFTGETKWNEPDAYIELSEPDPGIETATSSGTDPSQQLRVAIAPVISPETSLELYNSFVEYLAESIGREPVLLRRRSYAEVNDLVRFQQCDIAMVCTYAYVRGAREFGMQLLVAPRVKGDIHYYSFIIVPTMSDAESLLDLNGMRFGSADLMSTSGWLSPMLWLKNNGQDPENFFSEHLLTGSHDNSIFAVVSGLVDGAAVDSLVYEQMVVKDPALLNDIKVIGRSEPYGTPPIVVPAQIDPELKQSLLEILTEMHMDTHGSEILTRLDIDQFEIPSEDLYDSVEESVASWEGY